MIKVTNLNKQYAKKSALDNICFDIEKGKILGLLGPNGSGKSTLMDILAGTIKKTSGDVCINGSAVGKETKSIVSYLPEYNHFYRWMRVKDALEFYDTFYSDFDYELFSTIKKRFKLGDDDKISSLSKGAIQKLRLGLTLSRRAKIFLLDEPIGGIDTLSREEVIDSIFDCISEDTTIIIATHLINEVERLFDQVLFIQDGKKILFEDCDKLRSDSNTSIKNAYLEIMRND